MAWALHRAAFEELYRTAPDSATHAAAGWALRRWKLEPPALLPALGPAAGRNWFVNSLGMTFVQLPPAGFVMGDRAAGSTPRLVVLTRPGLLCDREVTVRQFRQFLAEARGLPWDRPGGWPGPNAAASPTDDCPVGNVTWEEAVQFCNWLSRRESRRPCYQRLLAGGWRWDTTADGYRLPAEAEWEMACRAGTATPFFVGEQPELLPRYANLDLLHSQPGGLRLPNAWGLFDILGNVWEMCWDGDGPQSLLAIDPTGADGFNPGRASRGGSFASGIYYLYSGRHFGVDYRARNGDGSTGFRVALGAYGGGPSAGQHVAALEARLAQQGGRDKRLAAEGLWACAEWRLGQRDKVRAAANCRHYLEVAPEDHYAWVSTAAVLQWVGDHQEYERHRRDMLRRYGGATDALVQERTAKACMLAPGTAEQTALCLRLAKRAVDQGLSHPAHDFFQLAQALCEYRSGQPNAARERLLRLHINRAHWNLFVPTKLVLALCYQQEGRPKEASAARDEGRQKLAQDAPTLASAGANWPDWLICQLLFAELEKALPEKK